MIELESMAVEMPEVEGHPNRMGFRGVLTVVDVASQRAPAGSKGHRVVLTRAAADAALPSLLGMALDYAPSFDRHDQRRKVGVITSAEIVGRNLEVGGYLYARDFPEVVEEIGKSARVDPGAKIPPRVGPGAKIPTLSAKNALRVGHPADSKPPLLAKAARSGAPGLRASLAEAVKRLRELTAAVGGATDGLRAESAGSGALGMSFEVADVVLADRRARVWILTRVTFTGAAILRRDKAAYADTWIELAS